MLVMSRVQGESIRVGDVVFTVVEIRGGRARIGIVAPKHIPIVRTELEALPKSDSSGFEKTAKEPLT